MIQSGGRSRLLELRRERAIARDGRALLDRKREAMLRAIAERLPALADLRRFVAAALADARGRLADAQLELGRTAVEAAALAQPRTLDIRATTTSLVGVGLPSIEVTTAPFVPRYGPAAASASLDRAAAAFAALLPRLVALAAHEAAIRRLRRALARTVRRLNALDSIVLPELSRDIRVVTSALEEEERDEAIRRDRHRRYHARNQSDSLSRRLV